MQGLGRDRSSSRAAWTWPYGGGVGLQEPVQDTLLVTVRWSLFPAGGEGDSGFTQQQEELWVDGCPQQDVGQCEQPAPQWEEQPQWPQKAPSMQRHSCHWERAGGT